MGGDSDNTEGELDTPLGLLILLCVAQDLCFFFSQLGFSHTRPSSNYRWDSSGWSERVFCQVPKIRLHHYPPRWHVSIFVSSTYSGQRVQAKRQMVLLAWNHVTSPCGLRCPPGQSPSEDPPQMYLLLYDMVSKMKNIRRASLSRAANNHHSPFFPCQASAFLCVSMCWDWSWGRTESRKKKAKWLLETHSYFKSKAVQGDKDPHDIVSCGEPLLLLSVALGAVLFSCLF